MQFCDIMRHMRQDAGVTLHGLARQLGVSVGYVSELERGRIVPSRAEQIRALATACGRDDLIDELLTAAGYNGLCVNPAANAKGTDDGQNEHAEDANV